MSIIISHLWYDTTHDFEMGQARVFRCGRITVVEEGTDVTGILQCGRGGVYRGLLYPLWGCSANSRAFGTQRCDPHKTAYVDGAL